MRRAAIVMALAALILPGCRGTDRPEGVVERWLVSLNQGKAGQPEKYAPDALSQQILPNWQNRDPGDLDVIEVGTGRIYADDRYLVPFRVQRLDGSEITRVAIGSPINASAKWRVGGLLPPDPSLPVPSEGGRRIGGASTGVWLAGAGIAVLLILLSVALMSTVARRLESPPDGHHQSGDRGLHPRPLVPPRRAGAARDGGRGEGEGVPHRGADGRRGPGDAGQKHRGAQGI